MANKFITLTDATADDVAEEYRLLYVNPDIVDVIQNYPGPNATTAVTINGKTVLVKETMAEVLELIGA